MFIVLHTYWPKLIFRQTLAKLRNFRDINQTFFDEVHNSTLQYSNHFEFEQKKWLKNSKGTNTTDEEEETHLHRPNLYKVVNKCAQRWKRKFQPAACSRQKWDKKLTQKGTDNVAWTRVEFAYQSFFFLFLPILIVWNPDKGLAAGGVSVELEWSSSWTLKQCLQLGRYLEVENTFPISQTYQSLTLLSGVSYLDIDLL